MNEADMKANQIKKYLLFHNQIELIFKNGKIPSYRYPPKIIFGGYFDYKIENFYIIDNNWIKKWKKYSNYELAKQYFNFNTNNEEKKIKKEITSILNTMISTEEINNSENDKPSPIYNGNKVNEFFNKTKTNIELLDGLLDENTYKVFTKNIGISDESEKSQIRGIILDKIIIFIFDKLHKIQFLYINQKIIKI